MIEESNPSVMSCVRYRKESLYPQYWYWNREARVVYVIDDWWEEQREADTAGEGSVIWKKDDSERVYKECGCWMNTPPHQRITSMDSPQNELVWIIEISPLVSHETGLSRMKDSRARLDRFCLFHNTLDDPFREKHSQSSLVSMPYPHFLLLYPHSWQRNRMASGSVNEQESSPVTMLHLRSHRRWATLPWRCNAKWDRDGSS